MESFVESDKTAEVFDLGDVLFLCIEESILPVWRYFEESSFFPNPARKVTGFREAVHFNRFHLEVGEVQFVYDSNIVVCCISLVDSSYDYVILYLGHDAFFHLIL